MDTFLEVFGGIKVGTVVLAIAGIMYKVFRVAEKFFRGRWELETEREEQMQNILEQVKQYPMWHEQSKQIRSSLKTAIDSLEVKIDHMSESVDKLQTSNDTGMALTWRCRILRFDDESGTMRSTPRSILIRFLRISRITNDIVKRIPISQMIKRSWRSRTSKKYICGAQKKEYFYSRR